MNKLSSEESGMGAGEKKLVPVYDIVNCGPRHCFYANGKLVHNSDAVNLQNFNRNQLVDKSTPSGTKVFFNDQADAVVEVLDDGKVHLARAGVVDNEEELLHVMGLRDALKAPKGKKLVVFDLSQVECVSGDGYVLTNVGLKKICDVSTSDLVFDGIEYVSHDGVMYKGEKDVIEYCGVVGTPEHIVYTRSGEPITLDQAAFSKAELCTGGDEWEKVWEVDGTKQTHSIDDENDKAMVSLSVRSGTPCKHGRFEERVINRVQEVRVVQRSRLCGFTYETTKSAPCEVQCLTGSCKGKQENEQNVQERGKQVQVVRRVRALYVGTRSQRRLHGLGTRPYRYQRTLRKGKSSVRFSRGQRSNAVMQRYRRVQWRPNVSVKVQTSLRTEFSFGLGKQNGASWADTRADHSTIKNSHERSMELQGREVSATRVYQTVYERASALAADKQRNNKTRFTELGNPIIGTIPVFDIINCGPRHRFCYNGVVVSNCRANAWEWGEQWVLDALVSGKDIYKVTAASTYGIPYEEVNKSQRFVGKSQVLGLGYGAGVNGLKVVMGKRSEEFTDEELQGFVNAYRAAASNIVRGWRQCKGALGAMASGVNIEFCKDNILSTDGHRIALPNGLHLTYRNIEARPGEMGSEFWFWGKNKQTKKPDWEKTFPGKIDENVTQSLCRIIMADIMLDIQSDFKKNNWTRDDAHICLTVHDEVIVCCKDEYAEEVAEIMQYRMKQSRDWYHDLPLDCAGDIAQRYGCAK